MRAIDADELKKCVLKWLPQDSCGKEEKEMPFETDICVSMLMEIDEQPTIQPDNCSEFPNNSDAISRQAAIDALASMYCKTDEDGYVWIIRRDAWARIDALPSTEPKRGKWIRDGHHIRCDQCGMYICDTDREGDRIPTEFCPNCGAKMEVTT